MIKLYETVYAVGASDNNKPAEAKGLVFASVFAENLNGAYGVTITNRSGETFHSDADALPALIIALREAHAAIRRNKGGF
jgi:hypothetical protein